MDKILKLNQRQKIYLFRKIIPIIILLYLGYGTYVYCKRFCWNFLYYNISKSQGISFITVYGFFLLMILISFLRINIDGPGIISRSWTDIESGLSKNDQRDPNVLNESKDFNEKNENHDTNRANETNNSNLNNNLNVNNLSNSFYDLEKNSLSKDSSFDDNTDAKNDIDGSTNFHNNIINNNINNNKDSDNDNHIISNNNNHNNDNNYSLNAEIFECELDGFPKWCSVCQHIKPDRTHHSSEIGKCVLKMDHYCVWVGKVIGFSNYKFFIQFLLYSSLGCIFLEISIWTHIKNYLNLNDHLDGQIISLIVIYGIFMVFSLYMFLGHFYLLSLNETTIERNRAASSQFYFEYHFNLLLNNGKRIVISAPKWVRPWDRSIYSNIVSVMGVWPWDWFLPIKRSEANATFVYSSNFIHWLREKYNHDSVGTIFSTLV